MFRFSAKLLYSALGTREPISLMHKSLLDLKRYFTDTGVSQVAWKELFRNPQYNGLCQRTKPILDPIRKTNPNLTPEMIDKAINRIYFESKIQDLKTLKTYFSIYKVDSVKWKDISDYKGVDWPKGTEPPVTPDGEPIPTDLKWYNLADELSDILDPIRGQNPKLTPGMIDEAIQSLQNGETAPPSTYSMSWGKWPTPNYHGSDVTYRGLRNCQERVLQINRSGMLDREIKSDPLIANWVQQAEGASFNSGHPAIPGKTVGWLRIDEVNKDYLLVDEIQADTVNALWQAELYVKSRTYADFLRAIDNNEVFKAAWAAQGSEGMFDMLKRNLSATFSLQDLAKIKRVLTGKFIDWAEVGMSTLLELAREEGIGMVLLNVKEVYQTRDPNFSKEKYMKMYKTIADRMGFKSITIDTPEISGTFLGRKP